MGFPISVGSCGAFENVLPEVLAIFTALQKPFALKASFAIFHEILELHVTRIDIINSSQLSRFVELRLLCRRMWLFFFTVNFSTHSTQLLAICVRAWMLLACLSISTWSTCIPLKSFIQFSELRENGPRPR